MDKKLWEYLTADAYEGERLQLTHKIFKGYFLQAVDRVLDEYGLAKKLEAARLSQVKLGILDIGCAEGLFLHDLALVLEERNLLDGAVLVGMEQNATAIATADQFSRLSSPPRPYLKFVLHDATTDFENSLDLRAFSQLRFDFIYLMATLELLPNAKVQLQRFYQRLNPGGVVYLRCVVPHKGEDGWLPTHPALEPLSEIIYSHMAQINDGVEVAKEASNWLSEFGAEQVQTVYKRTPTGGSTEQGRLALRNSLLIMRNIKPAFLTEKQIDQQQFNAIMETVYRDLTIEAQGQTSAIETFAKKPL